LASSISGAQVFYAGGGGGGIDGRTAGNVGLGVGGGGSGGSIGGLGAGTVVPTTGVANTGGGGGGGGVDPLGAGSFGQAGGSGIVIIRYPSYQVAATSTTGSPEMYVAGAWRVYKFVASGTITF